MDLNLNNVIRSAALVVVGLPLSAAAFMGVMDSTSETAAESRVNNLKAELTVPCIQFYATKVDSSLERSAKDTIDKVMGGDGIAYKPLCEWVIG